MSQYPDLDYRMWDWLPDAARECELYLERLLAEASIDAHDVSVRHKSIESFDRKRQEKKYKNPIREVTDIVAARIITYSIRDRDATVEELRQRFVIKAGEDRNPGVGRDEKKRGYDCHHLVVTAEKDNGSGSWMTKNGHLIRYFENCGGLEIQIRTVAAHAWAEFEHDRRYKGEAYDALNAKDQRTLDQLFCVASDARRALDETFEAIEQILRDPNVAEDARVEDRGESQAEVSGAEIATNGTVLGKVHTDITTESMKGYLESRYPEDERATDKALAFALTLVRACGIGSIENLDQSLQMVDADGVRRLMDIPYPVTNVRRLDDELLAVFGDRYIAETGHLGDRPARARWLPMRFDRLRGKVPYSTYMFSGSGAVNTLDSRPFPAARAVRELAAAIANSKGVEFVLLEDRISATPDLPASARPREVKLADGSSIWVATNLNRDYSESIMKSLLDSNRDLEIVVHDQGRLVGPR